MRSELGIRLALLAGVALALRPSPGPSPRGPGERGRSVVPRGSTGAGPVEGEGAGFLAADPRHRWSFPRDHRSHPGYRNEWWYFTGLLEAVDEPGRRFGYQLTFFRVGLVPGRPPLDSAWAASDAVMAHAAVTDLTAGRHRFFEILWRAMPLLGGFPAAPDPTLAWGRAPPGTDGEWTLRLDGDAFRLAAGDHARGVALALAARPGGPPVLEGPNGFSRKAAEPGYASLYCSYTRLATEGTLTVDGRTVRVRGTSWMDQEVGSSELAPRQVGWDWFSLRLADGRDLMLYVLRRAGGVEDWRNGTLVLPGGRARVLEAGEWSVRATGRWRSLASGVEYPAGWEVRVPGEGIAVRVLPELADQENRSRLAAGLSYWEGAVRVTDGDGRPAGEGYVELTGYGERNRPPI